MRNQRGVTLMTLVVYCVVMVIVIGIVSGITANAQQHMGTIQSLQGYTTELNKLSMYMVEETKNGANGVKKISGDGTSIEFKSGNKYIFTDYSIYKVSFDSKKIKICSDVQSCKFEYNLENKQEIVKTVLKFTNQGNIVTKTMEYVFTL